MEKSGLQIYLVKNLDCKLKPAGNFEKDAKSIHIYKLAATFKSTAEEL